MAHAGRKRPWLAALLSLVYPGLGHLYLRSWLRSLMWFGLVTSALFVLVPPSTFGSVDSVGSAVDAARAASKGLPLRTQGLLVGIVAMEAFDAYMLAVKSRGRDGDADSCPHCGKDLEEELDFCHWCSAELE